MVKSQKKNMDWRDIKSRELIEATKMDAELRRSLLLPEYDIGYQAVSDHKWLLLGSPAKRFAFGDRTRWPLVQNRMAESVRSLGKT